MFQQQLLQSLNMRKYLKSKEQSDNNLQIFKEAKRRFHYEPPNKQQKYFLHSKHKHQMSNQLKDDFSSVKEIKNQNNQINQSSWIVKLVNVMHQNSQEDLKMQSNHEAPNFLTLRPIESKEIQAVQNCKNNKKTSEVITIKEQTDKTTPFATKKNSYNIYNAQINNKRSKSQKSQSCDTVSKRGKQKSKVQTVKKFKNEVNLKRNRSQSLVGAQQQCKQDKMKGVKNLNPSQVTSQKIKSENLKNDKHNTFKHFSQFDSKQSLQSSKQVHQCMQSKQSLHTSKQLAEISKNYLKGSIQDKIQEEQNSINDGPHQKIDNILAQQLSEDLFALSTNHKNSVKTEAHLTNTQKRSYIGSIKKNRPCNSQAKNYSIQNKQIKKDAAFKKIQFDKDIKANEQEDLVTAREEQVLIEKYLNNDYSFKKQSNMFKYEYATSDFERQNHKNSIIVQRSINTAKTIITKNDPPRTDQKYANNKQRQSYKKFSYLQQNQKETTQNSLSLQILTLRCQPQTPKLRQVERQSFPKFTKRQDSSVYSNFPQNIPQRQTIEQNLRRIHQKYNYNLNKQNDTKLQAKKGSISTITTKRQNLVQIKSNLINRNPYLQQSLYKHEEVKLPQSKLSPRVFENPKSKVESRMAPNKQQYIQVSSNLDNLNSISKRQRTQSDLFSQPQSDQLIIRLNSKLNSYINHYGLQKPAEQQYMSEPTHRKMNLNFNQLKKHHDFFQR